MFNHEDRRRYRRAKIKLPVVRMAAEALVDGEILDLSLGGAFIRCSATPNVNDKVYIVISAKGRLISITGEVVWSDVDKFNSKTALGGMGVSFKKILNGDRRFLLDVIGRRQRNILGAWLLRK